LLCGGQKTINENKNTWKKTTRGVGWVKKKLIRARSPNGERVGLSKGVSKT